MSHAAVFIAVMAIKDGFAVINRFAVINGFAVINKSAIKVVSKLYLLSYKVKTFTKD